jgi:hypothetical protein
MINQVGNLDDNDNVDPVVSDQTDHDIYRDVTMVPLSAPSVDDELSRLIDLWGRLNGQTDGLPVEEVDAHTDSQTDSQVAPEDEVENPWAFYQTPRSPLF